MERAKANLLKIYGPKGNFPKGSWKEDSDKLFGPNEAVCVWGLLQESGLIPPYYADNVFVSPTANIPSHELAIWQKDNLTRQGRNLFLVGDLLSTNPRPLLSRIDNSDQAGHRFVYFRWDAEALPIKPNSADIIWDRKGWIWHSAVHIKDHPRLVATFRRYHQLLRPGGSLILDANDRFDEYLDSLPAIKRRIFLIKGCLSEMGMFPRQRPSEYYPGSPIGQYERSTVDQLNGFNQRIWTELEDLFRIQDVGQGILRHRALVKK